LVTDTLGHVCYTSPQATVNYILWLMNIKLTNIYKASHLALGQKQ